MKIRKAAIIDPLEGLFMEEAIQEAAQQTFMEEEAYEFQWSPLDPHPKQQAFLDFLGLEALYGGSAGGGKTAGLLMGALQYVHCSDYSALLLRRTYAELAMPGALIDLSHRWLDSSPAKWNEMMKTWKFPSGASITFGYIQHPGDEQRYRTSMFQYIAYDELTTFQENMYRYLFSRLRRGKGSTIPLRMRGASNPGGEGHDWVKQRFLLDEKDTRRYVPATLLENPGLDHESYLASLQELDEVTRKQLLEGDWDVEDDRLIPYSLITSCETPCLWDDGVTSKPRPQLYIGIDFGRTRDLTVIWIFELIGDVLWTREVVVLDNAPFSFQKSEILKRMDRRVVAVRVDQGGIGMQMTEELEEEFPSQVEGVSLNSSNQGRLGKALKISMENRNIRIPTDPKIREDFRLVRKIGQRGGIPILETERSAVGHADRFWACALGHEAAGTFRSMKPVLISRQPQLRTVKG